jgi:hypothetical protein
MPVPGPPDPSSTAPAGISDGPPADPVSAQEAAAVPGGVSWPVLAAGGALVAASTGLALAAGSRRPGGRSGAPRSFGSA